MIDKPSESDHQLVLSAQRGDFDAFRKIVLRYSNAMLSVAYSVLGDFHEAQDVAQEVFIKSHHQLHTLNDPNRLGSWLYSIAYRTSLDFLKKRKRTSPYHESMSPAEDVIHGWLHQHIIQEALSSALGNLEEKSKTAIVLYYLSDWSMKDISHFLDLSLSAVESRIRRAKDILKRFLAHDFETYFRPHRLGPDFEQMISEQLLKRIGHFYIPVTNKKHTTDWFLSHFNLEISSHGNLLLESGHELYLLECHTHSPKQIPVLTFSVSNADELWSSLHSQGVIAEPIEADDVFGRRFAFYDPDKNKYYAVENH